MIYVTNAHFKKLVYDHWRFLVIIFLTSFIIRLLFFLTFTQHQDNAWMLFDSEQYLSITKNILNHNGFCTTPGTPTCYRLPGYPLFLAAGFSVFKYSLFATLLFQIFLASFIPIGIFLFVSLLLPCNIIIAKWAAIIATIHTGFIIYAGMIASESLCLLFLLLFFMLFFYANHTHTRPEIIQWVKIWSTAPGIIFLSGIFLGFASLIRPIGHYILILTLMYCVLKKQALKNSICLILGFLIPVIPWLIRNFLLTGALFFHTLPGLHFLQFTTAPVLTTIKTLPYIQTRKQLLDEWEACIHKKELTIKKPLNEYEKCCLAEAITLDYAKQYPVQTGIHSGIQILKTCLGLYSAQIILSDNKEWPDYYSKNQSVWSKIRRYIVPQVKTKWLIPFIYWEILLFLVIILGCLFCFVSAGWQNSVLYMLGRTVHFASLLIFLTVAYGCARLRFPAEPFLITWSCIGWQQMLKKLF